MLTIRIIPLTPPRDGYVGRRFATLATPTFPTGRLYAYSLCHAVVPLEEYLSVTLSSNPVSGVNPGICVPLTPGVSFCHAKENISLCPALSRSRGSRLITCEGPIGCAIGALHQYQRAGAGRPSTVGGASGHQFNWCLGNGLVAFPLAPSGEKSLFFGVFLLSSLPSSAEFST